MSTRALGAVAAIINDEISRQYRAMAAGLVAAMQVVSDAVDPVAVGSARPGKSLSALPSQAEPAKALPAPRPYTPRKKKRRRAGARPLTAKQVDILERVAQAHGNCAKVANDLNITRQTVEKHFKAARAKIERARGPMGPTKKPKMQRLPTDRRGGASI